MTELRAYVEDRPYYTPRLLEGLIRDYGAILEQRTTTEPGRRSGKPAHLVHEEQMCKRADVVRALRWLSHRSRLAFLVVYRSCVVRDSERHIQTVLRLSHKSNVAELKEAGLALMAEYLTYGQG